ncbi:MAG: hypothetical protein V7K27_23070 [Nostoc sp.]|uniref:hypothetical protein n=1 Tax=Nostoc sp. TaxID=1180 RepID=UPI002FF8A269
MNFNPFNLNQWNQWLNRRQLQVLEAAYKAAQNIKALEDKYFNGAKITYAPNQTKTLVEYVQSLRDRQLFIVRSNLAQFRLNSFLLNRQPLEQEIDLAQPESLTNEPIVDSDAVVSSKLNFIDVVISKYREPEEEFKQLALDLKNSVPTPTALNAALEPSKPANIDAIAQTIDPAIITNQNNRLKRNRTGFFQGGFWLGRELDPKYEQQVVQEIRLRRKLDKLAIRWLLILLLVPVLIQILAKNLVIDPVLGSYSEKNPTKIELSREIKEEYAAEFNAFKDELEIQELLGLLPELSVAEGRERLQEKVTELWRESRKQTLNGLKNLMADGVAIVVFAGIVYFNRNKLANIRNFSNRTFLSLSDPVKVFIFILITDIFVGFHSAEGWEVLLEGIGYHFGLPESKVVIHTFIATVPVMMDSVIKFWIFTYFTQFSAAGSAIYERMNT